MSAVINTPPGVSRTLLSRDAPPTPTSLNVCQSCPSPPTDALPCDRKGPSRSMLHPTAGSPPRSGSVSSTTSQPSTRISAAESREHWPDHT